MKIAIFPGSFDPFTRGHQAVVDEALTLFDKVVIAIGDNVNKRSLLSVENRLRLIGDIYRDNPRIECKSYATLTGEFAQELGATAIIRGVRNTVDFEYERNIADINRLLTNIDTLILISEPQYASISSSMVRELAHFGKNVDPYLPK